MEMCIRSYQAEDKACCIAIFHGNLPTYFDPGELADFERWLSGLDQGAVAYNNKAIEKYFVIVVDRTIVGCGGYFLSVTGSEGSLAWGMIYRSRHGRGLGKLLIVS